MNNVIKNTQGHKKFWHRLPNITRAMILALPTSLCGSIIFSFLASQNFLQTSFDQTSLTFFLFISFTFIGEIMLNILCFKDDERITDQTLQSKYQSTRKAYKRYCKVSLIVRSTLFLMWATFIIWFDLLNKAEEAFFFWSALTLLMSTFIVGFIRAALFPVFRLKGHIPSPILAQTQTTSSLDMWDKSAAETAPSGAWVPLRGGAPVDVKDAAYFGRLGKD